MFWCGVGLLVGLVLFLGEQVYRWHCSAKTPATPSAKPEPRVQAAAVDQRLAVHEAGHAVLTWSCAIVCEFTMVSIDAREEHDADGFVLYKVFAFYDATPRGQWCRVVMNLGGIAAETMVYGKFRSGGRESDLLKARRRAAWLVECGETTPPWKITVDDVKAPPFAEMFEDPPSPEEVAVLAACWRMARSVLSAYRPGHGTLAEALVTKRHMDSDGVALVLGRRLYSHPVLRVLRRLTMDEWFYVPRLGAAETTGTSETSSSRPS